ncbi:MAG TPA: tetratricopeptide repeat protein, partial [Elusimicrobiales bacterium]|nr:tetratricopeptide repeat protein [Elusimicrobiales bacterium]
YRLAGVFLRGGALLGSPKKLVKANIADLEAEEEALWKSKPALSAEARRRLVSFYCASAQTYYHNDQYEDCAKQLDKAIAVALPGEEAAAREIIKISLICRRADKALKMLAASELHPERSHEAALFYAKAYVLLGDAPQADKYFKLATKLNPSGWEAYCEWGRLYEMKSSVSVPLFRKAAQLAPHVAHPHYMLGLIWLRESKFKEAEAEFKLALRANPADADSMRRLAEAYTSLGEPDKFAALAEEIPALAGLPAYAGILAQLNRSGGLRRASPRSELEADIASAVKVAQSRKVPVIVSSYPELSLPGLRSAAEKSGAVYADLTVDFGRRFKFREEFIGFDNVHCNTKGYRLMAEIFAEQAAKILALPSTKNGTQQLPAGKH